MEIDRLLIKENALAVAASLLEAGEPQGSFRKWHKLFKYVLTATHMQFSGTDGPLTGLK